MDEVVECGAFQNRERGRVALPGPGQRKGVPTETDTVLIAELPLARVLDFYQFLGSINCRFMTIVRG